MSKSIGTVTFTIKPKISLWSAIKLRISGFYKAPTNKITIQDLIE